MSIETRTPLSSLAASIEATDQHVEHRLGLARRAEQLLSGEDQASEESAGELALKLERWRYQHLNEQAGRLTPEDIRLADAIDLAACALAGRDPRPPRRPRAAIDGTDVSAEAERAAWALDPGTTLDEVCRRAAEVTEEQFGPLDPSRADAVTRRRMLLYAPLYLSSQCINLCPYCGFHYGLDVRRKHLTTDQALAEAEILQQRGFCHVLLVAGELPSLTTTEYYAELIREMAARGLQPAIEIAPQSTNSYAELAAAGACGITLYQETYDERLYRTYHRRGPKASFDWRLEGVERAAEAGIRRLGLGILLGLAEPREDMLRLVRHAAYLAERFPGHTLAFGLPRLHETPEDFAIPYHVGDGELVRFYSVLRIAFPKAELVLSTRETAELRARLARICITQMSAGSSTAPGGYGQNESAGGEQFPITDHRSAAEVAAWLREAGFEPVWEITRPS